MKTLYISDLDGTLLNPNVEVSSYTIETLNKLISNGMFFTCATARTAASVTKILESIAINVPMVLMNGSCIYDSHTKKYERVEYMGQDDVSTILKALKSNEMTGFMYEIADHQLNVFYENLDSKPIKDFHDERVERYQKQFTKVEDFLSVNPDHIMYFCLLDKQDKIEVIYKKLLKEPTIKMAYYKDIYSKDFWYLEIFSIEATKYNAVNYLRSKYNFERIVGFGDNLNDLPLFQACDESYAVANAKDEVKAAADDIIDNNLSHGVARWLNKYTSEGTK